MLNEKELIHTVVVTGCVSCLCPRHESAISNTVSKYILVRLAGDLAVGRASAGGLMALSR